MTSSQIGCKSSDDFLLLDDVLCAASLAFIELGLDGLVFSLVDGVALDGVNGVFGVFGGRDVLHLPAAVLLLVLVDDKLELLEIESMDEIDNDRPILGVLGSTYCNGLIG